MPTGTGRTPSKSDNGKPVEPNILAAMPGMTGSQPCRQNAYNELSPNVSRGSASDSSPFDDLDGSEGEGEDQSESGNGTSEDEGLSKGIQSGVTQTDESCGQEQQNLQPVSSAMSPFVAEYIVPQTQLELGHPIVEACAPYPNSKTYYCGLLTPYGAHTLVHSQLTVTPHRRVPLPPEIAEETVYVNAKQYHGIIRRRQSRAKAELEKKVAKVRKPYLHESRHQHAMRRVRGCGGRFLNTKDADGSTNATDDKMEGSGEAQSSQSICSVSEYPGNPHSVTETWEMKNRTVQGYPHACTNGNSAYQLNSSFDLSVFHSISDEETEGGDCSG